MKNLKEKEIKNKPFFFEIISFGEFLITIILILNYYLLTNGIEKYLNILGFFNIGRWLAIYLNHKLNIKK